MVTAKLWPIRPSLRDDESFSSWFARTAWANGLRPSDLYRCLTPGEDRSPGDLDRYVDDELMDRLAESADVDSDEVRQATFRRWAGTVFTSDDGVHKLPWLPPAGRQNGKRCHGQQICPECLALAGGAYLRLSWRLSFVTTCPVHGCLLLDRCPVCNDTINILRQDGLDGIACWACGHELRQTTSCVPPVDPVPTQQELSRIASQGWMSLGAYGPVYSFVAFALLDIMHKLLASGRHAHALRTWVSSHEPALAIRPETIPRAREGALLSPRARSALVPMAYWLLTAWPTRLVAAAEATGMSCRHLLKKPPCDYPFAYAHAVEWYLREPSGRHAENEEVAAAREMLHRQGKRATSRALAELFGTKAGAVNALADRGNEGALWGQGRYWKLDGVSPEVKAAARKAAHQAGEGVGTWIESLIRRELRLPDHQDRPSSPGFRRPPERGHRPTDRDVQG